MKLRLTQKPPICALLQFGFSTKSQFYQNTNLIAGKASEFLQIILFKGFLYFRI